MTGQYLHLLPNGISEWGGEGHFNDTCQSDEKFYHGIGTQVLQDYRVM